MSQPAIGATTAVVRRTTGLAGLGLFIVGVVGTVIHLLAPGSDATGSAVDVYVLAHYHVQQLGVALDAAAVVMFVIFTGHLSARVRRADAAAGDSWGPVFLLGAAGTAALGLAAAAAQAGYQELAHAQAVPAQILDVYHVATGLSSAGGLMLAVVLFSIGVSSLLNGTVPVPLAWVALATSVVGVVAGGGVATARTTFGILNLVESFMFLGWTLGVSGWLLLTEEPPPTPIATASPRP